LFTNISARKLCQSDINKLDKLLKVKKEGNFLAKAYECSKIFRSQHSILHSFCIPTRAK